MREQFLSASPMPHSLGTFLAEQESTAPGREYFANRYIPAILYLYCIAQKMPCFFQKNMLEFRLRKYGKNQFIHFENSGFFRKKGVTFYVFIRLCMG